MTHDTFTHLEKIKDDLHHLVYVAAPVDPDQNKVNELLLEAINIISAELISLDTYSSED